MSFLTRTTPLLRTAVGRQGARAFSTSMVHRKIVPEPVKDAVKTVDRAVSEKIVDGIELGQKGAQKVKEVAGMSEGEMKGKAHEVAGQAHEVAGQAKGKASEVAGMPEGEMKGKAHEVAGQAKGKANELAGEAKGKKEEMKGKL